LREKPLGGPGSVFFFFFFSRVLDFPAQKRRLFIRGKEREKERENATRRVRLLKRFQEKSVRENIFCAFSI